MRNCSRLALLMIAGMIACSGHRTARAQTLSMPHPDDATKTVEYFMEKPKSNGPWPTIVFLHGHQEGLRAGGKDFVTWGVLDDYAGRGYLAISISQPGYGNSTGAADFCGPFTQHAVEGVLRNVRAHGYVRDNQVLLFGVSRGAVVAGLVAAHDPSIRGMVLISGLYDLPDYVSRSRTSAARSIVTSITAETGGNLDALKSRSLLYFPQDVHAQTLILNGAKDDRTDPEQAVRLAAALNAHGGNARAIVYPEYCHQIPVEVRNQDIDPFLDKVLNH